MWRGRGEGVVGQRNQNPSKEQSIGEAKTITSFLNKNIHKTPLQFGGFFPLSFYHKYNQKYPEVKCVQYEH